MYQAGFIGCGNMGGVLATVAAKSAGPGQILVVDHHREKTEALARDWGCVPGTAEQAAAECEMLFLGVKPQAMGKAAAELREPLGARSHRVFAVSMAAGLTTESVSALLGGVPVLRILPNTPAAVGKGVVLYSPGAGIREEDTAAALALLAPAGLCAPLPEEKLDAGSAITGCGPAFVCLFAEALTDAGIRCGLPRSLALEFALRTLEGTARLALDSGLDPALLRAQVCSPAGSTIEGVAALEKGALRSAVLEAVDAAWRRSSALGK